MDLLVNIRTPVMLIGAAGCGKTVLINEKLIQLDENYMVTNVPFNFYYTAEMLQKIMEKPLEKKAGKNYGPPGNKKLIYFIDDMNMPEVDCYGTVAPHTLIRYLYYLKLIKIKQFLTYLNISDNTWIMVIGMTETSYLQKIFTIANMWLA